MAQISRCFVFVALTGDEEIKAYSMDLDTGALELRTTSKSHGPIGSLFLHRASGIVYGAQVMSTELSSYHLDTDTGALTHINSVDTGLATPALAITDLNGRFLISSYYTGGGVTIHRIADDGSIGELVQHVDTGEKAHGVLLDATNSFVFIPHVCPNNKTAQFRFDADSGQLTENDPFELTPADDNTGPRHMCFGPGGDIVYTVNEQGNTVTVHRYDANSGTLEVVQNVSTLPDGYSEESFTAHIEIHPNGKWAYASNRGPGDSIVGFNIAADGTLSPFGHFSVHSSPRSFNIDPTGHFCYCTGEAAGRLRSFRVDQTSGNLTQLDEFDVGESPFWTMVLGF
ncbi:MAG: beta-propeller fold lactonase family protein [Candidatus Latescibacterota bacterium]|nr:beta-propeller fold lactonase family protein [Candidatus Latescibacterota bacterium]